MGLDPEEATWIGGRVFSAEIIYLRPGESHFVAMGYRRRTQVLTVPSGGGKQGDGAPGCGR